MYTGSMQMVSKQPSKNIKSVPRVCPWTLIRESQHDAHAYLYRNPVKAKIVELVELNHEEDEGYSDHARRAL